MELNFKKANEENRKELESLSLYPFQEGFIETVRDCLLEADGDKRWVPAGIYDGDVLIGFAMYGCFYDEEEQVWMDRLLIDKKYQGKGYGKEAVEKLKVILKESYHPEKIYLSVYEDNPGAVELYKKAGFYFNGKLDINGEKIMAYDVK